MKIVPYAQASSVDFGVTQRRPPSPDLAYSTMARIRATMRQRWENQITTAIDSRKNTNPSMSFLSRGLNSNAGGINAHHTMTTARTALNDPAGAPASSDVAKIAGRKVEK